MHAHIHTYICTNTQIHTLTNIHAYIHTTYVHTCKHTSVDTYHVWKSTALRNIETPPQSGTSDGSPRFLLDFWMQRTTWTSEKHFQHTIFQSVFDRQQTSGFQLKVSKWSYGWFCYSTIFVEKFNRFYWLSNDLMHRHKKSVSDYFFNCTITWFHTLSLTSYLIQYVFKYMQFTS